MIEKKKTQRETLLQWKALLFRECWHFLFREAAGCLWKTGLREEFYVLYATLFLEIDMLRGKADASSVIRPNIGESVLEQDLLSS